MKFIDSSKEIIFGTLNGQVKCFNIDKNEFSFWMQNVDFKSVTNTEISNDGSYLAFSNQDGSILVKKTYMGEIIYTFKNIHPYNEKITLTIDNDNTHIFSVSKSVAALLDYKRKIIIHIWRHPMLNEPTSVFCDVSTHMFAVGTTEGTLLFYDSPLKNDTILRVPYGQTNFPFDYFGLAILNKIISKDHKTFKDF